MTFIEMLIAIAIIVVAFVGFYDVFIASAQYVQSAAAREGALSLATEKMEEIRAMQYAAVGTVGGIPDGLLPQNETITQDGITYNRRTLIVYVDDPADGLGAADENHDTADYKLVKVEVSWPSKSGEQSESLVSNFIPDGIESDNGGGTLILNVINALGQPFEGAAVVLTQGSAINVTSYSNDEGEVEFPGTPEGSGYHVVVGEPGFSTAQTYPADADNPNPNPGDLTVAEGQTTSQTFAIDRLASLSVGTWKPVEPATTTDTFANTDAIAAFLHLTLSNGLLELSAADGNGNYYTSGSAYSTTTAPARLAKWTALSWHATTPAQTSVLLHLYQYENGQYVLIPDSALPGNGAGFSSSPVSLSGISTTTYPSLVIGAAFSTSDSSTTPELLDWSLSYKTGPTPIASVPFLLEGAKTIGAQSDNTPIYKVSQNLSTDGAGSYATSTLEWDSYTTSVPDSSGYDVSSYCPSEPLAVPPGSSVVERLFLLPHTTNSLLIAVASAATGKPVSGAAVSLSEGSYAGSETTDGCGDAFFPSLTAANDYAATVSAPGFSEQTVSPISVSGASKANVSM